MLRPQLLELLVHFVHLAGHKLQNLRGCNQISDYTDLHKPVSDGKTIFWNTVKQWVRFSHRRENILQHNDFKSYSQVLCETLWGKETLKPSCVSETPIPLKVGGSWQCSVTTRILDCETRCVRISYARMEVFFVFCGLGKLMFSHLYHLAKIHLRTPEIFCSYSVGEIGLSLYLECCCWSVLWVRIWTFFPYESKGTRITCKCQFDNVYHFFVNKQKKGKIK